MGRSTYQGVKLRVVEVAFGRMMTVLVGDAMELEKSPLPLQSVVFRSDPGGVGGERGGEGGVRVRGKVSRREERRSGREVESKTDLIDVERWKGQLRELRKVGLESKSRREESGRVVHELKEKGEVERESDQLGLSEERA